MIDIISVPLKSGEVKTLLYEKKNTIENEKVMILTEYS